MILISCSCGIPRTGWRGESIPRPPFPYLNPKSFADRLIEYTRATHDQSHENEHDQEAAQHNDVTVMYLARGFHIRIFNGGFKSSYG